MGTLSRKSTVKTPILEGLQGRTNDVARLPSGKVVPGLTFYYVTKSVIEEDGNVSEFVIEQTALDVFKVIYTAQRALSATEETSIRKATYKYLEEGLTVIFEKVEVMDRSNRGKLKQFVSKLP
jgi:phenylacetate-CoA ligase